MLTIDALKQLGCNTDEGLSRCMGNEAFYFKSVEDIKRIIENTTEEEMAREAKRMKELAVEHYRWETIAKQYYDFFRGSKK